MFDKSILFFFYFFLFSRFFSEKLKILPKAIDVINFPVCIILLVLLFLNINSKLKEQNKDYTFIVRALFIFIISFLISLISNMPRIIFPSAILFLLGFIEGPVLFLSLTKFTKNITSMSDRIRVLFLVILIANLILVMLVDMPVFLITANPDVISGSYGNNTYQFSILLIICSGLYLGWNYINNGKVIYNIIAQLVILVVFYLSQFRAALPFFIISFTIMVFSLYGKRIYKIVLPSALIMLSFAWLALYIANENPDIGFLRVEEWEDLITNPSEYLHMGKFKIYLNVLEMYKEFPEYIITGTGPGNFMSRANFTFSYELMTIGKGVGKIINDVFGISQPYFTYEASKYANSLRGEIVFGTVQLSNPATSYLAPISEIGIFGGIAMLVLYVFLVIKSFVYNKILIINNNKYVPLSVAFLGSSTFLFMLGFLDDYWEIARVTLPVWLLFWVVSTVVINIRKSENT